MQSILLIAADDVTLDSLGRRISEMGESHLQSPERFVLESSEGLIAINLDREVPLYYGDEELRVVSLENPQFFVVEFEKLAFLKRVLPWLANDERIWVDNDHGDLMRGPAFVERIARDPSWDWRT